MARGTTMRRARFSERQQNTIINAIERLGETPKDHPSARRCHRVANRLRYFLAGVDNSAQWAALYDTIESNYARHRISYVEAIIRLREIGIDAKAGLWRFPADVEQTRRFNAPPQFRPTEWEMKRFPFYDPDYHRDAKRNGDFDQLD